MNNGLDLLRLGVIIYLLSFENYCSPYCLISVYLYKTIRMTTKEYISERSVANLQ